MANSVHKNPQGPLWPLGSVVVGIPGTPVNMMVNIDSGKVDAPETATTPSSKEYTVRAQQIIIQGFKAGAGGNGLVNNTGNIYVVLNPGVGSGTGNRSDQGSIIECITPGQTAVLASAPLNRNVFNPYELYIDSDNGGDAAQITLLIQ